MAPTDHCYQLILNFLANYIPINYELSQELDFQSAEFNYSYLSQGCYTFSCVPQVLSRHTARALWAPQGSVPDRPQYYADYSENISCFRLYCGLPASKHSVAHFPNEVFQASVIVWWLVREVGRLGGASRSGMGRSPCGWTSGPTLAVSASLFYQEQFSITHSEELYLGLQICVDGTDCRIYSAIAFAIL